MDYSTQPGSPSSSASSNASSASSPSWGDIGGLRLPNDDDLRREGMERIIQRLRHVENEHKKLLVERSL